MSWNEVSTMQGVMKAAITSGARTISVEDVPIPDIAADEALVRVEVAGICGSDMHYYLGDSPYSIFPRRQGHEFCGIVEAMGSDYRGSILPGERVAVEPLISCGTCFPCRNGSPNCCTRLVVLGAHTDGAFAQYVKVKSNSLYAVGDLEPELAAFVEPFSIGIHAIKQGNISPKDQVVVFGAGPIGQTITMAAVDAGARVLVIDRIESRLHLAQKLGAERTVIAGLENEIAIVKEWTNGDGPSVIVDAIGIPTVIRTGIEMLASSGRMVIVGISDQEVSIPIVAFTRKEMTIVGSRNNVNVFGKAVDLVQRKKEQIKQLVTHRFPLDQMPEAMEFAIQHPHQVMKVMIHM